jgi:Subtilase family
MDYQFRLYAIWKRTPELFLRYSAAVSQQDLHELTQYTRILLRGKLRIEVLQEIKAVSAPSLDWPPTIKGADSPPNIDLDELVIAYGLDTLGAAEQFIDFVVANQGAPLDTNGNAILNAGADPGGNTSDHWCPGPANRAIFRHRDSARRTVNADALQARAFTGRAVNAVIIDQGLDQQAIKPQNWGGGLGPNIGQAPRTSHGMMVARSILDLAPDTVLYDVPLIPPRITGIPAFISTAQVVYQILILLIRLLRQQPRWSGPWILVNAWSIYDRRTDRPPFGSYTENRHFGGHPMINIVTQAVQQSHLDVVFASGNCGEFCPDQRCGGLDRGPGHSIWGANAHPLVITAGAVRIDETWLGYSSQGPGPAALATSKPDLCAPSQFCESNDAAVLNSGSSAACAMTAGVLAALRGNPAWDQLAVTPATMKAALIGSARKTLGPGWNERLGYGILDAANAIAQLP